MHQANHRRGFPWVVSTCLALVLIAGSATLLCAGPPSDASASRPASPITLPALTARDRDLLKQLEQGTWRERQKAEAEVAAWKPAEEPTIQAMFNATQNPEVRARLLAIMKKWDAQGISDTSLITLHLKGATAKVAFTELFRQAMAPTESDPAALLDDPNLPKVTLDADHRPFWEVVQQLSRITGIGTNASEPGVLRRGVRIVNGPQAIVGPFLCVLVQSSVRGPLQQFGKYEEVDLVLYPEPKIRVAPVDPTVRVDKAMDNRGNDLKGLFFPGKALAGAGVNEAARPLQINFDRPANNSGDRLTCLVATLTVPAALALKHAEINDPMHAAAQAIHLGGFDARFEGLSKSAGWYQVTFGGIRDQEGWFTTIMEQPRSLIRFIDDNGNDVFINGIGYGSVAALANQRPEFSVNLMCPASGPMPRKVICDLPTTMKNLEVPVEFKDVAIPFGDHD